jgi:hypothetical protein
VPFWWQLNSFLQLEVRPGYRHAAIASSSDFAVTQDWVRIGKNPSLFTASQLILSFTSRGYNFIDARRRLV